MAKRRDNNEGSLCQIKSGPKKGQWRAKISNGKTRSGNTAYKEFHSHDKNEDKIWLKMMLEMKQAQVDFTLRENTFESWIMYWMETYKRNKLKRHIR